LKKDGFSFCMNIPLSLMTFSQKLLKWHLKHSRELPWKKDKDPYKIWISEIILQQTRVAQGLPYYERFIQRFPDIPSLASANEDELMQVWQGLGYYSRARNMHHSAKLIMEKWNGRFPDNYQDLLSLKGVGPYTAAAIASFAFDENKAVVDGNVIRVLSRFFGIYLAYDTGKGKKVFQQKADELIDANAPGAFNQAIMDFGATLCLPKKPECKRCPFQEQCQAKAQGKIDILPVRSKSIQRKKRYFTFWVLQNEKRQFPINKRGARDIWKSLYEFPLLELDPVDFKDAEKEKNLLDRIVPGNIEDPTLVQVIEEKQLLTHQEIHAKFIHFKASFNTQDLPEHFYLVDYENLCNFAFPKIIDWFIDEKLIPL
jgi:A/G-specific adenine glycosylase